MPIKFGDAQKLKKGQIVIALGNPYAIARDGQASASWGIVVQPARARRPPVAERDGTSASTLHQFGTLIQTDAKLNLGTSGGALVNLQGRDGRADRRRWPRGRLRAGGRLRHAGRRNVPRDVETLKEGREVEYGLLGVSLDLCRDEEPGSRPHGVRVNMVSRGHARRAGRYRRQRRHHARRRASRFTTRDDLMLNIGQLPAGGQALAHARTRRRNVRAARVRWRSIRVQGKKIVTNPAPAWRGMRVDYRDGRRSSTSRGVNSVDPPVEPCVVVTRRRRGQPGLARRACAGHADQPRRRTRGSKRPRNFSQRGRRPRTGDVELNVWCSATGEAAIRSHVCRT